MNFETVLTHLLILVLVNIIVVVFKFIIIESVYIIYTPKISKNIWISPQSAFTCSKLTIETLEQGDTGVLLLTLDIFYTLF